MNSRQLVYDTLSFSGPKRVPRQLWLLPWGEIHHPQKVAEIAQDYPDDIVSAPGYYRTQVKTEGEQYEPGEYVDEWGCRFTNRQRGIIGEIKHPLIREEDWADRDKLRIPVEMLDVDSRKVNEFRQNSDKFVLSACFPRPFERLQFIRGTEQLYVDLMLQPEALFEVLERIHDHYCRELEVWAKTDIDGIWFMDDWGSQRSLLIRPEIWVDLFKPLYKDYIDIAHRNGKKSLHAFGRLYS